MIFDSERSLSSFAEHLGLLLKTQKLPLCLELVGDVGAGKTTFTRALAKGLGIKTPVTSPSFTISKRYEWSAVASSATHPNTTPIAKTAKNQLVHYDFYRLADPGIMSEDLSESLSDSRTITIIEWADSVTDLLPEDHPKITFKVLENGNRELLFASGENVLRRGLNPLPKTEETYIPDGDEGAQWNDVPAGLRQTPTRTFDRKRANRTATSLFLDTSSSIAKIKLTDESGNSFEYEDNLGRRMAEKLLETLKSRLEEHGKTFNDLERITFMSGPGSFTGLRIGATVVNTLAHELQIPLYDHRGIKHQIILPDYGRPARITPPKK